MKILIDTNIIIGLEDSKIISKQFSEFYRYALSNNCKIFYHEACLLDIINDRDSNRRDILTSKMTKYQKLANPAVIDTGFIKIVGQNNNNDKIDNIQLFQVYSKYVDYFITEDKGILKKAKTINIRGKTLNIEEILQRIKQIFDYKAPTHPILNNVSVRLIKERLCESFFDSLKNDYSGFEKWFDKCVIEDRSCYYIENNEKIISLLIYNIEKPQDHRIEGIFDDVLKICTLKVAEDAFGLKIGELFLNLMSKQCIEKDIKYMYLTTYNNQISLVGFLRKFNFEELPYKTENQSLFLKEYDKSKVKKKKTNQGNSHPFYSDSDDFKKYIIPIRQEFYNSLFKDSNRPNRGLFDKSISSIREIHSNSIFKVYISNAKIKSLKKGDILFFYLSKTEQNIYPVGILDKVNNVDNFEKFLSITRGKSVFNEKALEKIFSESKKPILVIEFRLLYYLKEPIDFKRIKVLDSFSNNFQTITKMKETDYKKLKEEGYFNERYIIN